MKNITMKLLVMGLFCASGAAYADGKVVRATDMAANMWSDLSKGKLRDVVIEFRQGDELPMTFEAQGDLVETRHASVSYVGIKKNFWLRVSRNEVEISWDGTVFKKLNEVLKGSFDVGAGSTENGGVANGIAMMFKAFIK